MQLLDRTFLDNTLQTWAIAVGTALLVWMAIKVVKTFLQRRMAKLVARTRSEMDDLILEVIRETKFFFPLIVAIYVGAQALELPELAENIIAGATVILVLLQAGIWGSTMITFWVKRYMKRRMQEDAAAATSVAALSFVGKLALWAVLLLLALDNLGYDVTALVAGLGIGGIAVALALQNVLGDLFASLSIVLDKPFVIGDFIIVGDYLGTVEHIGLKTTRVRSLGGEQLVFSNGDLLESRIRNYKRMAERRVLFGFGVVYQTPPDALAAIPGQVREIIESIDKTRFDRAHFKGYGDSSLDFEVVYYVLSPDYNMYMDIQQEINLEVYRRFAEQGIDFAYPTRTLYVIGEDEEEEDEDEGEAD
jgi:small-conductance mechanosensitive channel